MIIDLHKFIDEEEKYWTELEGILKKLEEDPLSEMSFEEIKNFHYLYQRTSADLAKIKTFSSEIEICQYLEALITRAYGEVHETREKSHRFRPFYWFFKVFPRTFRRHLAMFWLSVAVTMTGFTFGGMVIAFDPGAKDIVLPFPHLQGDPSDRVNEEEQAVIDDRLEGAKSTFSTYLMTHNIRVSIFTLSMGITWGIGTIILLFYNGIILGAVSLDYILAGETKFLLGWLLPHGSIEIPAILLAGQGGLLLAGALIGWGNRSPLRTRLREISGDLVTLIFGGSVLLVWAGFIEAFLSQYHEPVLPYSFKIGLGIIEMFLLFFFLFKCGMQDTENGKI